MIRPGSWIYLAGESRSAGTLGLIVEDVDGEFDGLLGLGAAHTIGVLSPRHESVRDVWAPPPKVLCGGILDVAVGTSVRSAPDTVVANCATDAAVFHIERGVEVEHAPEWRRAEFPFTGIRAIEPVGRPIRVHKVGAKTGLTSGWLDPIPITAALADRGRWFNLELAYAVTGDGRAFADSGDSGAAVFDEDGLVVGLVAGMLGDFVPHALALGPQVTTPTLCVPIIDVFEALHVRLPR